MSTAHPGEEQESSAHSAMKISQENEGDHGQAK